MTDKKSDERAYDLRAVVAAHRAACEKRGSWRRLGDFEYDAIAGTVLRQQREGPVEARDEAVALLGDLYEMSGASGDLAERVNDFLAQHETGRQS
jgi:hypothetical protein